ncbi:MAG: ORF6N domain-containing protein [Pirellulales bacterium]|nr:ORF6N domain-containing protein [Pirellulales bacterium]
MSPEYPDRFPADFCFQLLPEEFAELKSQGVITGDGRAALRSQIATLDAPSSGSQNATSKRGRHAKYSPYAFTEHGAIMAANVLNSPEAVDS